MNYLCLSVFFMLLYASSLAQVNHLNKKISLHFSDLELNKALPLIADAGEFNFSYNADFINSSDRVSLNEKDQTVKKCLRKILSDDVKYKVVGNHVILLREKKQAEAKKPQHKPDYVISGYIKDVRTGLIIKQATVYDINKSFTAITDEQGFYKLTLPDPSDENRMLNFSKKGYLDTVIIVRPKAKEVVNVQLRPKAEKIARIHPKDAVLQEPTIHDYALVKLFVPKKTAVVSENLQVFDWKDFKFSILPFLDTDRWTEGSVTNYMSLNLIAGYSSGVEGFELGGFANMVSNGVEGIQVAGFTNIVGRNVNGWQISGFLNLTLGQTTGIQLAGFGNITRKDIIGAQNGGFFNFSSGKIMGVQYAGFLNIQKGKLNGAQLAGFCNVATKQVDGIQAAGFTNVAIKKVKKTQIAGFNNYAESIKGVQAASFANIASKQCEGVQVSGFFNYTKKLSGVQLSTFNYADTVSGGVPIGFFSYVRQGYRVLELSYSNVFPISLSFRTGTTHFYNIFSASYKKDIIALGYGIGTQFKLNDRWDIGVDLQGNALFHTPESTFLEGGHASLSATSGFKVYKNLTVFIGPSFNVYNATKRDDQELFNFYDEGFFNHETNTSILQMWVSLQGGIRF